MCVCVCVYYKYIFKYTIQIQADSVVSDTNGFINFWLRFMATRRERHNSYYADPTNVRRILWSKISIHLRQSRPEKLNRRRNGRKINGRNSTLCLQGPISTDSFSKSSNSQDHLLRARRHPHSSLISCLGVYYDNGDYHILCARA